MTTPLASSAHYPHINLLRAFAALTVLVYHVIEHTGWESFPREYPLLWFRTGWMAVDLFLVISGFVITLSLLQWEQKRLSYRHTVIGFMKQRWWRIAPLYLLTGACYIFAIAPNLWGNPKLLLTFATFTQNLHLSLGGDSINGISWSVVLEMQFYLFLVATLPYWHRMKIASVFLTLLLIALASRSIMWELAEYYQWEVFQRFFYAVKLPCVLDEFAAGICLALWVKREQRALLAGVLVALLVAIAIPVFKIYWANASYWNIDYMFRFWRTGLGLFFGLILAVTIAIAAYRNPPLLYRAASYLGDISYGIYLWHLVVILMLKHHTTLTPPALLAASIGIVLALAVLSWHGIEKPLIAYGKKLSAK